MTDADSNAGGEHRSFAARLARLPDTAAFVASFCARHGIERTDALRLMLIVEELFTNTVMHGHGGDCDARIGLTLKADGDGIAVLYEDHAPAYDPLARGSGPAEGLPAPPAARAVGGLGLLLVRHFTGGARYERRGGRNRLWLAVPRRGAVAVRSPDASDRPAMLLQSAQPATLAVEREIYGELLLLATARIVELGCGRAEHTRAIAAAHPGARITAFEVDADQHARNLASAAPPNVRFAFGGAEAIPAADGSFDVALMFKSLHHVPTELLDRALAEIGRVLAPGGLAYFSEPVFAGEYNELIRIFHDEERVRAAAFAALERAVAGGTFELVAQRFFAAPVRYASFAQFEEQVIGVTHTAHRLTPQQHAAVRERFMRNMNDDGAVFIQQMRVDLLRKRA